jgi:hypothetical protein
MTERGLPIVDGAPACPFVAFEDDRDSRAGSPDHRHRCYAEVRPAPRALAHQEAYCLSSAFPVCPTFQDWARREAAQARADAGMAAAEPPEGESQRNPPRAWSSPPPWTGGPGGSRAPAGQPSGGLSGSMADRLAAGEPIDAAEPDAEPPEAPPAPAVAEVPSEEPRRRQPPPQANQPARRPPMPIDPDAPSWERPRRMEAYPTLRARVGLPSINLPPLLIGVVALALASLAVFLLPGFLGLGSPAATSTPNPSTVASAAPSASVEPTPSPVPTQQIYTVESGDTLSGIATRFGLTIQQLKDANPQITNVDAINIGDEIIIPASVPTEIPDAGSPSPEASAAP